MIITDKSLKKLVKSIKCYEVKESIESYPEQERGDKTDLEIIRDEVEYFIYMFEEVDGAFKDDLDHSREILRKTHNGKTIPIDIRSFKPIYPSWRIDQAKRTVSEYKQLKRILIKLEEVTI